MWCSMAWASASGRPLPWTRSSTGVSHRTEPGGAFVELALLAGQLTQQIGGKGGHQLPAPRRRTAVCGGIQCRAWVLWCACGGAFGAEGLDGGAPDIAHAVKHHKSDHEELGQLQMRRHAEVLFHGEERGQLSRIRPLQNYPSVSQTRPCVSAEAGILVEALCRGQMLTQRDTATTACSRDSPRPV